MKEENTKILVVEDEDSIRKFIVLNLSSIGFKVFETSSGEGAVEIIRSIRPDVVVLDIMLPGIDGFQVCEKAREIMPEIMIIMLTARSQDMDKIMGLELGADDYMVKPFNPLELIARIRAMLRRADKVKDKKREIINSGNLCINLNSNKFFKKEREVELTPTEFMLLKTFMESPGKAFSRDELLNSVWGQDYFGDVKTVDVHIRRLREKIEDTPSNPFFIETVWGFGYRWREEK